MEGMKVRTSIRSYSAARRAASLITRALRFSSRWLKQATRKNRGVAKIKRKAGIIRAFFASFRLRRKASFPHP